MSCDVGEVTERLCGVLVSFIYLQYCISFPSFFLLHSARLVRTQACEHVKVLDYSRLLLRSYERKCVVEVRGLGTMG